MATIQFENGKEVEFEGNPTPEDVDFVAQQIGITAQPQEQKPEGIQPTFKASIGGAETIIPNIAKTFGNVSSSAANLTNIALESTVGAYDKSLQLTKDIYKDRGFIEGTKDIASGFADTAKKIFKAPGEFLFLTNDKMVAQKYGIQEQNQLQGEVDKLINQIYEAKNSGNQVLRSQLSKKLALMNTRLLELNSELGTKGDRQLDSASSLSNIVKYPIERPLDIPLALYGGNRVSTGTDIITDIARPVTRGTDTSLAGVVQKGQGAIADYALSKRPQAINELEQTYTDLMSGTTPGKKKVAKIETKTEALNRAGTEGRTPQRTLAEEGIIPNRSGTKLDTFEQAQQYREKIKPFREANRQALKETELGTMPRELADLERQAIEYARTPENINAGRFDKMEKEIRAEFDLLRKNYPDGNIPLNIVDDIKSARWDNVFKNKGLIDADVLKKDSEYAIAKALQKDIEEVATKAGHKEVAQLNREIGDRLEASRFLEELNGKTLKGGRLLKFVTTGIGASFGNGVVGKLAGALGGNMVGELIIANNVSNPIKRIILKNLERTDPKAYTKTIEWLKKQNLDRETRLLLPEARYIPMGSPKPKPNEGAIVTPAQKNPVSVNPKTGRFQTTYNSQSKSPTSQQTKPATTRVSNIPPIIPPKPKKGNLLDKFKNTPNKQGGFIQAYKGEKDLTTKILKDLEGKTTVSKQYILDATNRGELKQVERDITRQVLEDMTRNDNIITKDVYRKNIKSSVTSPNDKNIYVQLNKNVPISEIDTNGMSLNVAREDNAVSKLSEATKGNILVKENPDGTYKLVDGRHRLAGQIDRGAKNINVDVELLKNPSDTINVKEFADKVKTELLPLKVKSSNISSGAKAEDGSGWFSPKYEYVNLPEELRGKVKNYKENVYQSPIETSAGSTHFSNTNSADRNYFGHTRIEDMADNKTRRVIEVQSDLYQKGNLERDMGVTGKFENTPAAQKVKAEREANYKKLTQYNDPTAHFRMVREEIKKASQDGKTKLQFPTGETAMKIEGLVNRSDKWVTLDNKVIRDGSEFKVGDLITFQEHEGGIHPDRRFLITENKGDGTFKAVDSMTAENDSGFYELLSKKGALDDGRMPTLEELVGTGNLDAESQKYLEKLSESLSAKDTVDTNNPIYKFYEKDVQKYLNKFGGKKVVDDKGVEWIEVPIKKEQGKQAVEAFGKAALSPLFIGAGVSAGAVGGKKIYDKLKAQRQAIK